MLVGYARTNATERQSALEVQTHELKAHGCIEVFQERASSGSRRDQLERCLQLVRKDDGLVVTELSRLARSIGELVKIIGTLGEKGATLKILGMNLDTGTERGRLLVDLVSSIAQFEREIRLERQREGIGKAKDLGKYKGRAATARAKASEVQKLRRSGKAASEIAIQVGISRASVYRILAEA
ncbi:recombinase family protein [Bradyrhizobium sp. ISRA442]|uniref:recombinase family protein n=1 Tax=Bradyrhizobium sp. ISRA442 TaxID=2866197 RepID=UPI00311AF9E7